MVAAACTQHLLCRCYSCRMLTDARAVALAAENPHKQMWSSSTNQGSHDAGNMHGSVKTPHVGRACLLPFWLLLSPALWDVVNVLC
jgi:hypothetical protein